MAPNLKKKVFGRGGGGVAKGGDGRGYISIFFTMNANLKYFFRWVWVVVGG